MLLLEKYEVCRGLFHGFDWSRWFGTPQERLTVLPATQEHILAQGRIAAAMGEAFRLESASPLETDILPGVVAVS
jgi:hypothetical protein